MRPLTNVQLGTLSGTLCSLFASITLDDLVKTVVLATLGAICSYGVSRLMDKIRKGE